MGTIHEMPGRYSDRESAFTDRLLAERDRLAEFDRKPDLFARFAANDQRAYDKPLVAFFRRRGDRLFWLLIGATIGLFLTDALVLLGRGL